MHVCKGDRVRTAAGDTGVVLDTWGIARYFFRLKRDSDGASLPMFQKEIVEVIHHLSGRESDLEKWEEANKTAKGKNRKRKT